MNELLERARAQLMMIEQVYALKIKNREDVARIIAGKVDDNRQVLMVCSSLNSWVMLNRKQGEVIIPHDVLERLFKVTEWQNEHA